MVIPTYGQRRKWVPTEFGDGGAFPECPVMQYPLGLGKKASSIVKPLLRDADGNITRSVVKHSTTINALKEKDVSDVVARPSAEQVHDSTEKTRSAIEKVIQSKIKAVQPKQIGDAVEDEGPKFIKYTPHQKGDAPADTRIVRMAQVQQDPMEPPRFKIRKTPRPPPSPPAPILHSPPRKVSAEEQKNWVIPPCISNWKNAKGYTIPLDKRLAADGRGVQDVQINDNFAKLAEALYVADRHVREEVKLRADMQAKLAAKEKKEKEEKLRQLAQRAREERAGLLSRRDQPDESEASESEDGEHMSKQEHEKLKEREEIRRDRQKLHEKEIRLTHMSSDTKSKVLSQLGDRDISEKIALGIAQPTLTKESMYDQRLFNQSAGMTAGFGDEDSYNLYDKPLFSGSSAAQIYRPTQKAVQDHLVSEETMNSLLAQPTKGFSGASGGEIRAGPVQFEKEEAEEDPFGLEQFLSSAKRGRTEEEATEDKRQRL